MNDCPNGEIRDQLPDYLHERLDRGARAVVELHLSGCADCLAELKLLTGLRGQTRRAVPAIDIAAIVSAVPAYRAPAGRSWAGWRMAAAVTLLAAGASSVAVLQRDRTPLAASPQVVASAPAVLHASDSVAAPLTASPSTQTGVPVASASTPAVVGARSEPARELAMGGGTVSDLSETEIAMLVDDLESLDVVPAPDVDPVSTSPVAPDEGAP